MTKANIWMTHPMCLYILKNDAPCFGLNPPSSARKHHSKRHSSQRGLAYEYSPITICHEFINICKVLKARRKQELAPPAPHHRWPGRTDSSEEAALNKHTRFLEGWELRGRLEADCGAILRQTGKPHISHREVRQQVQPNTSKHIQTHPNESGCGVQQTYTLWPQSHSRDHKPRCKITFTNRKSRSPEHVKWHLTSWQRK